MRWRDSDGSADFEAQPIWLPHQRVIPHRCFSRSHQFQQGAGNSQTDRLTCDSCAFVGSHWVFSRNPRDVRYGGWWLRFIRIDCFASAVLFHTNLYWWKFNSSGLVVRLRHLYLSRGSELKLPPTPTTTTTPPDDSSDESLASDVIIKWNAA